MKTRFRKAKKKRPKKNAKKKSSKAQALSKTRSVGVDFIHNKLQILKFWIVIALFRLILHQMEFRLVPNQSVKCSYRQIWFNLKPFISYAP